MELKVYEDSSGLRWIDRLEFKDQRGQTSKVFQEYPTEFQVRQVLISSTIKKNTVRGMFIQKQPFNEAKLISWLSGSMFWVSVDLRTNSDHFGKWYGHIVDSTTKDKSLFIPKGFAHGCVSLDDNTSLLLLADSIHSPEASTGFKWDDPDVNIDWPVAHDAEIEISEAHNSLPSYSTFIGDWTWK